MQDEVQRTLELLEANPLSDPRLRVSRDRLRTLRFATVRRYPQFVSLYLPTTDGHLPRPIPEMLRRVKGSQAQLKMFEYHAVYYQPTTDGILVVRVLHTSHNVAAIFRPDPDLPTPPSS